MTSNLAAEILDRFTVAQNLKLDPMVVVDDSPLSVNLNGDTSTTVAARSLTGAALTVGATGFALWAPPMQPLVFTAGDDDTEGNITYESGFTSANGGQLSYHRVGRQVFLAGGADRTSGDYTTTASMVAVIPAADANGNPLRPARTERFASYGTLGRIGRIEINTSGEIRIAVPNNGGTDEPFGWMGLSHVYLTD